MGTPRSLGLARRRGKWFARPGIHDLGASATELARASSSTSPESSPLNATSVTSGAITTGSRPSAFAADESTFAGSTRHWPERDGASSLGWGDARVANISFVRVSIAFSIGNGGCRARELDIGWCHSSMPTSKAIAESMGHTGLPEFLRRDNVVAAYTDITGYEPQDLDWYLAYAALRQALVSIRVSTRAVHFGEREQPDDPQDLIMVRSHLEGLLER